MSFTVAIVPEDPTNNGYILRPLVRTVLTACGRPHAKVSVISNPRTQGYVHAKRIVKEELIRRYKSIDLLLFLPDADGQDRSAELNALEREATSMGTRLLCCAAQQEVETWLLAGHHSKLLKPWQEVRSNASVKEEIFDPFLREYGDSRKPGAGREDLMLHTLSNYSRFKDRCPEIDELERRIRELIA